MFLNLIRDTLQDKYARFLNSRADAFWRHGDLPKAEKCFRSAVSASGRFAPARSNLGAVLMEMHRYDEGLSMLEHAARLNPKHPGILVNLGNVYYRSGRTQQAIDAYQYALALHPNNVAALTNLIRPLMEVCDWDTLDGHLQTIETAAAESGRNWLHLISPYNSLFMPLTSAQQLVVARYAALRWQHAAATSGRRGRKFADGASPSKRIRIGYLSGDFHDHATAHLTQGIYGRHSRSRFEVYAYSIGCPDASAYRQKIAGDCDKFIDVHKQGAQEIAALIARDRIDILLDLKGYTGGSRPDILALRPAPIQVSYLGHPGTMGADFIDFLIADPVVVPDSHSADYSERIVRLPTCYQPTDDKQAIAKAPIARAAVGLPSEGFVFCCFNTSAKIDRRSFSCWLKILARVPNSVLWLLQPTPEAQINLAEAAGAADVDPARIVYGPFLPKPQHLARLRFADLVLDTFLYNAHTTATDALWSGVPVVTLTGGTFASRVATSLLHAVQCPGLATRNEEDYVELAVKLATDKNRLARIRNGLSTSGQRSLFNTTHYVKNLEEAYEDMYAQQFRW